MKHVWKMLMAALVACMLLLSVASAADGVLYGETNRKDVPAMNTNSLTGNAVFTLSKGYEFRIYETLLGEDGDPEWYRVICTEPGGTDSYLVYIYADYVTVGITPGGNDDTGIQDSTDSTLNDKYDVTEVEKEAKATLDVGVSKEPNTNSAQLTTIPAKTVVDVTGEVTVSGRSWYRVKYNGKTGFVPASLMTLVVEEEEEDDRLTMPKVGDGVIQNTDGVRLREGPGTNYDYEIKLKTGDKVELLTIPEKMDQNHWFLVRYDGKVGYIQAPYVKVKGADADDDDTEETDKIVGTGIIIDTDGVKFREGPGTNYDYEITLKADTPVNLLSIPEKVDKNHWYKVLYNGQKGYIQAPYVKVLTKVEDDESGEDEEEETTPTLPEGETKLHDGVIQNTEGVRFRKGPGTQYEFDEKTLPAGVKVSVLSPLPEKFDKEHWFKVFYNGKVGYIQAPYVYIKGVTDKEETPDKDDDVIDPDTVVIKALGVIQKTNGVNFRAKPDKNATSWAKLSSGKVVEVVEFAQYNSPDYWFTIRYDGKVGYIQAPYVYVAGLTLPEPPEGVEPEKPEEGEQVVVAKGVIQDTNGVNLRAKPDINSTSYGKLKAGEKVDILEQPVKIDKEHFFKVRYGKQVGYIQAPYVYVLAEGEEDLPVAPDQDVDAVGIGMITSTNGVNLREAPSANSKSLDKLSAGMTVQLLKIPSGTDVQSWFKVRYNDKDGYIQAPYVVVLKGTIPEPEGDKSDVVGVGVVTSANGVNFRTGPGKDYGSMGKIPVESSVELLSVPKSVGDDYWYKVRYNGKKGYVQSPYIRVVSIEAGALPDVEDYGYAKLLESSANLRDEANGNTVVSWKGKGSLLRIAGDSVTSGYYEWFPVFYPADSAIYYVRADMVQIVLVENGQLVTPTPAPASRYGYVKVTKSSSADLRILPDEESIAKIPKDTILVCVNDPVDPKDSNYTWYEVKYNGMYGYVRGDHVGVCDRDGKLLETEDDEDSSDDETYEILGYIKIVPVTEGNRVRLREKPAGDLVEWLDKDLILPVIEDMIPGGTYGQNSWYKVRTAAGKVGYVRGDCAKECDEKGNLITKPEEPETPVITGYVMITGNEVFVRETPFGVGLGNLATNTVWPIVGPSKTASGITWYYISAYDDGKAIEGYIHSEFVYKFTEDEVAAYKQDPTYRPGQVDKPDTTVKHYVMTVNTNGLNLRDSYSQNSTSRHKLGSGVVMEYIATKKVGTVTWYNVIYQDVEYWAHGDYLHVMTDAEYKAYLAQNPSFEPNVDDFVGYFLTLHDNVYVRNAANGSVKIETIEDEDTVIKYYSSRIDVNGEGWYRVLTPANRFGYVRADEVVKCDKDGKPIVPSGTSSAINSQQETTYSTLRKGNKGKAVTNLVNELINQGFYTGKTTSSFTTAVKEAVEAFQAANGLDVDGVADSTTQHKLFGTVPIGAGNTNNREFVIYNVEKIDWFTGGIQEMLPRGANFKLYDVKTGKVWWAHRWAGAYHADIETLSRADSNILCDIYGVDDLDEIVEKNLWKRRPCLVTIGTRTFACSLDGMQHNPDGDTIGNNGMDGQICLHFTNSQGHASGAVSESHAEAIEYAYKHDYSDNPRYQGK